MTKAKNNKKAKEGRKVSKETKRHVNWGGWLYVIIMIFGVCLVLSYVFNEAMSDRWAGIAEQRQRQLYDQAEKIEADFNEVYSLRNATIKNGIKTEVILDSDMFQLKLIMNADRSQVEKRTEIIKFNWLLSVLFGIPIFAIVLLAFCVGYRSREIDEQRSKNNQNKPDSISQDHGYGHNQEQNQSKTP